MFIKLALQFGVVVVMEVYKILQAILLVVGVAAALHLEY